jgi:hypothetical protein
VVYTVHDECGLTQWCVCSPPVVEVHGRAVGVLGVHDAADACCKEGHATTLGLGSIQLSRGGVGSSPVCVVVVVCVWGGGCFGGGAQHSTVQQGQQEDCVAVAPCGDTLEQLWHAGTPSTAGQALQT